MFGSGRKHRNPPVNASPQPAEGSLAEGVPAHLETPLRQWVMSVFADEASAQKVALHLQLRVVGDGRGSYSPVDFLARRTTDEQLLKVIDVTLRMSAPPPQPPIPAGATQIQRLNLAGLAAAGARGVPVKLERRWLAVDALQEMLTLGGSAYRVNEEQTGLEIRVDATAHHALASTLSASRTPQSGSAAQHLATAWKCAYGRDPDPSKAYSEAIKAVESASQAVIEPNNAKATLGTMLGVIRNSPQRFATAIPAASSDDITLVADMMRRLWQGQTARHGSQTPTRLETQPEAEMAVHLAVTLVQWFAAGLVHRKP
jgi:hypothetical protein